MNWNSYRVCLLVANLAAIGLRNSVSSRLKNVQVGHAGSIANVLIQKSSLQNVYDRCNFCKDCQ